MSHLVSIVIPAYNAAKRIEATLLSIAAQDYNNIEIIVVCDASTDNTDEVAERVLQSTGRKFIMIRPDTNMGVSVARNVGLSSSSGDYVIFVDSDDLPDPNFVSVLLGAITKNNSDAAFCGYRSRVEDTGEERAEPITLDPSHKYSAEELTIMTIRRQIMPSHWTTIFKTSFLKAKGLKYNANNKLGEDFEFLVSAFSRCSSINFSAGCHYVYMQHSDQRSRIKRQTPDDYMRSYMYYVDFLCSTARYLMEHAESPKVRHIAMGFLLTDGLVRVMNISAWQHDKLRYNDILYAPETRSALKASFRYFQLEPGLVLKAAALLAVPKLYFWIRYRLWKRRWRSRNQ